MADGAYLKNNFNGGALDLDVLGRIDLKKVEGAALAIENMVPLPSGAVTRRDGVRSLWTASATAGAVVLDSLPPAIQGKVSVGTFDYIAREAVTSMDPYKVFYPIRSFQWSPSNSRAYTVTFGAAKFYRGYGSNGYYHCLLVSDGLTPTLGSGHSGITSGAIGKPLFCYVYPRSFSITDITLGRDVDIQWDSYGDRLVVVSASYAPVIATYSAMSGANGTVTFQSLLDIYSSSVHVGTPPSWMPSGSEYTNRALRLDPDSETVTATVTLPSSYSTLAVSSAVELTVDGTPTLAFVTANTANTDGSRSVTLDVPPRQGVIRDSRCFYAPGSYDDDAYDADALTGVDGQLRSEKIIFNASHEGAWLRFTDTYPDIHHKSTYHVTASGHAASRWAKVVSYVGPRPFPTSYVVKETDTAFNDKDFYTGHIYRIPSTGHTSGVPSFCVGASGYPNTSWSTGMVYNAVKDQFLWAQSGRVGDGSNSRSGNTSWIGASRVEDITTRKDMDVVNVVSVATEGSNLTVLPANVSLYTAENSIRRTAFLEVPVLASDYLTYAVYNDNGSYRNLVFTNYVDPYALPTWYRSALLRGCHLRMKLGSQWVDIQVPDVLPLQWGSGSNPRPVFLGGAAISGVTAIWSTATLTNQSPTATPSNGQYSDTLLLTSGTLRIPVVLLTPIPRVSFTDGVVGVDAGVSSEYQLSLTHSSPHALEPSSYPSCVAFHEQRLYFSGYSRCPEVVFASALGNYFDFATSEPDGKVLDTTGFSVSLSGQQVTAVRWLQSGATFIVGTSANEWSLSSGDGTRAITPATVRLRPETAYGSTVPPLSVNGSLLLVRRGGRSVIEYKYSPSNGAYKVRDLLLLSRSLVPKGAVIESLAYAPSPYPIVVATLTSKVSGGVTTLRWLTLTYDEDNELCAWAAHSAVVPSSLTHIAGRTRNRATTLFSMVDDTPVVLMCDGLVQVPLPTPASVTAGKVGSEDYAVALDFPYPSAAASVQQGHTITVNALKTEAQVIALLLAWYTPTVVGTQMRVRVAAGDGTVAWVTYRFNGTTLVSVHTSGRPRFGGGVTITTLWVVAGQPFLSRVVTFPLVAIGQNRNGYSRGTRINRLALGVIASAHVRCAQRRVGGVPFDSVSVDDQSDDLRGDGSGFIPCSDAGDPFTGFVELPFSGTADDNHVVEVASGTAALPLPYPLTLAYLRIDTVGSSN